VIPRRVTRLIVTLLACAVGAPVAAALPKADLHLPPLRTDRTILGLGEKEVLVVKLAPEWSEGYTQTAIQGQLNRSAPTMWLDNVRVGWDQGEGPYKDYYHKEHGYTFRAFDGSTGELITKVAPLFNGLVVFEDGKYTDPHVFHAMNLASLNGLIPVSRKLYGENRVQLGSVKVVAEINKRDVPPREPHYMSMIATMMPLSDRESCFSVRMWDADTTHPSGTNQALDYAFFRKSFMFAVHDGDNTSSETDRLTRVILKRLKRPGLVMGWGDNEGSFCRRLSECGHTWMATACAPNLSFHAMVKPLTPPPFKQSLTPRIDKAQKKVYLAVMSNEGDTATVLAQLFYRAWFQSRGRIPITWGLDPLHGKLFPAAVEYLFRTKTDKDFIMPGPSGAGYFYPDFMSTSNLRDVVRMTAKLQESSYPYLDISLWGCDDRAALDTYLENFPGIRGITINTPIKPGAGAMVDGRFVPVLGHPDGCHYWITNEKFFKNEKLQTTSALAFFEDLYTSGPLPRFVPLYGVAAPPLLDQIVELSEKLDPAKFEFVDYGTLYHLAAQHPAGQSLRTVAPLNHKWSADLATSPGAFSKRWSSPIVKRTTAGLHIEVGPGQPWAAMAIEGVQLPANAQEIRVRVSEIGGSAAYSIYLVKDYLGFGGEELDEVFRYSTEKETRARFSRKARGSMGEPFKQLRFDVLGKPGSFVVIEGIDILTTEGETKTLGRAHK
jgi:hypothetical protein